MSSQNLSKMLGNCLNKADVNHGPVDREKLTKDGDVHPHLDLSLSLTCEGTSGNVRNVNPGVVPSVGVCRRPVTNAGIQDMTMGTFGMETFIIGRARARIDHWRRANIFVERASGLLMVYPPTWTVETATVAVNAALLHGRVLGHAGFVMGPTGSGNYICPPFLIRGSTDAPPVPSQSGFNNYPAPYILPPIRSNNLVPMFATSVATGHPLVVTTTGNGPIERQIYGVIIGQGASGEMHIMCSCHGIVLSPAAFVEHAGGTSSGQPMDRIIACLRPIPF